jgi:hypothetical protein
LGAFQLETLHPLLLGDTLVAFGTDTPYVLRFRIRRNSSPPKTSAFTPLAVQILFSKPKGHLTTPLLYQYFRLYRSFCEALPPKNGSNSTSLLMGFLREQLIESHVSIDEPTFQQQ